MPTGRYLYGPPAAGLALEGDVVVKLGQGRPRLRGLRIRTGRRVRDPGASAARIRIAMDEDGKATIPDRPAADAKDAETARSGNQPQAARSRWPHHRTQSHVAGRFETRTHRHQTAVRQLHRAEDQSAGFDVVLLDPNNKPETNSNLTWTLTRLDTNWQWYRRDGSWTYEAVTVKRKIGSGPLSVAADKPAAYPKPSAGDAIASTSRRMMRPGPLRASFSTPAGIRPATPSTAPSSSTLRSTRTATKPVKPPSSASLQSLAARRSSRFSAPAFT